MEVITNNKNALVQFIEKAGRKFWYVWISGELVDNGHQYGAVLYKPSGIMEEWEDSLNNPHQGNCVN